jgi:uncharacterized Tic20 family protein
MTENSPQPAAAQPLSQSDERLYATLAHAGIILVGFVAPLVMWLIGKDRSAFVDSQAKEALNFSILVTIGYIIGWVTTLIFIGFLIIPVVWIGSLVMCIMAAMAANKGTDYRYPFNWRLVK